MQDLSSQLRHSVRGTLNALKLGVSALDAGLTFDETLEFLDYIVQATEKMETLLDQYETLPIPDALAEKLASTPANAVQ